MKIKILTSASHDLIDGYWFYEKQSEGVGAYFLDTLYSDIDSLVVNAGIHPRILRNTIAYYQSDFRSLFITVLRIKLHLYMLFLIAVGAQRG